MTPIETVMDEPEYMRDSLPPIFVDYGGSDLLEIHTFTKNRLIRYHSKLGERCE